jgi:hypothetical protein
MIDYPKPLDLRRIRTFPLAERQSLSPIETLIKDSAVAPPAVSAQVAAQIRTCARAILERPKGAAVMLLYGAHLIKNGAHRVVQELMEGGFVTHLATNGAGTIHDWELSFLGRTEESVRKNVAAGCFGTWEETGRCIHLALLAGGVRGEGYGRSLGRFITEDGVTLPSADELRSSLRSEPEHPLTPARAELLQACLAHHLPVGRIEVPHRWKQSSIVGRAFEKNIPFTVHPGIGYDIISNHPMFNGAAIGRAAAQDFRQFGASVEDLDQGIVLSVGSAIMAPQVFEKSLSCVNNLRLQDGRSIIRGHQIYVVDIQDGGGWDWTQGEPSKANPAYYLRFCKSFARMGGAMSYVQADNLAFLHQLLVELRSRNRTDL